MVVYSRMATVSGATATPTVQAQCQDLRLAIRAFWCHLDVAQPSHSWRLEIRCSDVDVVDET